MCQIYKFDHSANCVILELNEIVEGNVEYLDDIKFDNEVFLYIVRSPYPRAIIRSIVPPKNTSLFTHLKS
ncbi:hypothetical protein CGL51_14505 [Pyrobaculum aerophilum]|uniref:Uncharacterized protein n=1 Tax=Pyrobaculum aerophilum TaxID=13773 RepID=A0A371QU17_9CREN|nr:hypothetical protein CGL51_14505 [Pyrobaculum aerophilum]